MLVIWLLAAGGSAEARDLTDWNAGELILRNGTEYKGELRFNWKAEVIQYRQGVTIKAYSASQIQAISYFDKQQNIIRKFVDVDYPTPSGQWHPRLFEQVVAGPIVVYREMRRVHELIKVANLSGFNSIDEEGINDVQSFTYFVATGSELLVLDDFYHKVWPTLTTNYEHEIREYSSHIHAVMPLTVVRLRLISLYNSLVERDLEAPSVSTVLSPQ